MTIKREGSVNRAYRGFREFLGLLGRMTEAVAVIFEEVGDEAEEVCDEESE